jgi:hypothetical protein
MEEYDESVQQSEDSDEGAEAEVNDDIDYRAAYEEAVKKAADSEKARKKEIAGLNRRISELETTKEAAEKKAKRYDRRRFSDEEIEEQERQEEIAEKVRRDQEVEQLRRELERTRTHSKYNAAVNSRADINPINRRIITDWLADALPETLEEFQDYLQDIADEEKRLNKLRARRGDVDLSGGGGTRSDSPNHVLSDREYEKMNYEQRREYFNNASDEELKKMWKSDIRK